MEEYSPGAVAGRAFAFDGVVVEVGAPLSEKGDDSDLGLAGVTLEVREWFVGGEGASVTIDMVPPGGLGSTGHGPAYEVGTRLLVSGQPRWGGAPLDDAIAWTCGFTRYHDAETAAAWRRAVGSGR